MNLILTKASRFFAGGAAAVAVVLSSAHAFAGGVTVGHADAGNCYPFSCGPTDGLVEYQEVYNKAAFPGAITFNQISFTMWPFSTGPMDSGAYAISFYLASRSFPGLSKDLLSNLGSFLGNFGTFDISGPMPPTLALNGARINYDPALGDLLMDVNISNGSSFNGLHNAFLYADETGSSVQRAWFSTKFGAFGNTTGALQTTFSATVPEPATWAMLILGVAMIGFAARRRSEVSLAA